MKNLSNLSWILKSSALALGLNLLGGCGTEIGNGRKPPVLPDSTKAGNTAPDPTTAPDEGASENSPGEDVQPLPNELEHLFIACGSPIPDLTAGTYVEASSSSRLTVTVPSTGTWKLVLASSSYVIERNTAASSQYAIKSSLVTLGKETCSQPTTAVNGSETEKSIVYSTNYKTTWILDGNAKVTNIKVIDPSGTTVKDWTAQ